MKDGVPSKTAIGPAMRRAIETAKPKSQRICCDEYAQYFLTKRSTGIGESRLPRWLVNWWLDHVTEIGVGAYIIVRTRYFDDAFVVEKRAGCKQLVVLGAGYDTRAYRLINPEENVAAYEVDFPATQERKKSLLKSKLPNLDLSHVRYVPVDFMTTSLADAMAQSDYRSDVKSFFVWEGVTCYLTEDAVRKTLEFVAQRSAPGSVVAFDYLHFMPQERVASRRTWHDAEEPLYWGIAPEKLGAFLDELGLELVENIPTPELGERYWRELSMKSPVVSPTFSCAKALVR